MSICCLLVLCFRCSKWRPDQAELENKAKHKGSREHAQNWNSGILSILGRTGSRGDESINECASVHLEERVENKMDEF